MRKRDILMRKSDILMRKRDILMRKTRCTHMPTRHTHVQKQVHMRKRDLIVCKRDLIVCKRDLIVCKRDLKMCQNTRACATAIYTCAKETIFHICVLHTRTQKRPSHMQTRCRHPQRHPTKETHTTYLRHRDEPRRFDMGYAPPPRRQFHRDPHREHLSF